MFSVNASSTTKVHSEGDRWETTKQNFLKAIDAELRPLINVALDDQHTEGAGIRDWVAAIVWRGAVLPETIPNELIRVYLDDSEAQPLHDCEACGIAIPIRPNRLWGMDGEPERIYFSQCPRCGGRTGWHLHCWQKNRSAPTANLRNRKPR